MRNNQLIFNAPAEPTPNVMHFLSRSHTGLVTQTDSSHSLVTQTDSSHSLVTQTDSSHSLVTQTDSSHSARFRRCHSAASATMVSSY